MGSIELQGAATQFLQVQGVPVLVAGNRVSAWSIEALCRKLNKAMRSP
jgi:hypothetical protein